MKESRLLDIALALKVLTLHKIRYLVIVVVLLVFTLAALLEALVGFGELSEGCERVWAELVEDAGDELGELFVLAVAVDGEGVGWDGGVDCGLLRVSSHCLLCFLEFGVLGVLGSYPSVRRSG